MGIATPAVKASQETAEERPGRRSFGPYLVLAAYLFTAFYETFLLWGDPAGRMQSGDNNDVDQAAWFMRYSAEAIAHFHLPELVTSAMNAPHTVNLMWNTSLLLPGVIMTPVTLLAGPQVSLNVLLVIGLAGSAASMYFVLRRWGASILPAFLGGGLYGFSPAMIGSGIGHYHLVLAMLPPLMIDALLRIVTGRGSVIRNGIWLGVLAAAQLFIGEEALILACIAGGVLLVVLVCCRPRSVLADAQRKLIGLGSAAIVALVLCARALWVQFHGVPLANGGAYNVVLHNGKLTHLYTIPYAWVVPSSRVLVHTYASAKIADTYPQPAPEYLAYLGIPLIILLLAAGIYFWRVLYIRVAFLTFLLLELLSLGGQPIGPYPGKLLPWSWLGDLPGLKSVLPDRLSILADGAAAAVLAFALDQAIRRWQASGKARPDTLLRNPAVVCYGIALIAMLPLAPTPYGYTSVSSTSADYTATYTALHLPSNATVLVVPVPNGNLTMPLRWYADTGVPQRIIGGDFIDPSVYGHESRSGRAAQTPLTEYLNALQANTKPQSTITSAQVVAQMAAWKPAAIMAYCSPGGELNRFLTREFGPPQVHDGYWLGWRLNSSGM